MHVLVGELVDGARTVGRKQQGVAIGRRLRDRCCAEVSACAGPIFNDEPPAGLLREFRRERTGEAQEVDVSLLGTAMWVLSPDIVADILKSTAELVAQAEMSGVPMSVDEIRQMMRDAKTRTEAEIATEARARCKRAERKLEDMMVDSGFTDARYGNVARPPAEGRDACDEFYSDGYADGLDGGYDPPESSE